ncbi:hypothetical protein, partial [Pseudomonas protegens]|uniref:hypothetical protein n=1 Tax=Pseudomonas protegens TaxID=380021 RepID=UPI001CA58463
PDTDVNKQKETLQIRPDDEFSSEVDRLENLFQSMNKSNTGDPEMQQINSTLERILDIQHPQRVKDKIKEKSLKQKETV